MVLTMTCPRAETEEKSLSNVHPLVKLTLAVTAGQVLIQMYFRFWNSTLRSLTFYYKKFSKAGIGGFHSRMLRREPCSKDDVF